MTVRIILLIIIIAVIVYSNNPKVQQKRKWKALQPYIASINEIHARASGNGKKISVIEKGNIKKKLANDKKQYVQYMDFCKSKQLQLPADCEQVLSVVDETEDLLDPKQALDKALGRASKLYDETYAVVNTAGETLLEERNESVRIIDDAEKLVNSIARHPKEYDKDIAEVSVQREQFKGTIEYSKEQEQALKKSAGNAAAGVAAGAGVATLAPTAAMWVATTFGTASTGTAISALSGAAATNAALAWLGGGALAAGGGGMVAGQALLTLAGPVGWGIAGGSFLVSVLLLWKKKMNVQESKKEEIARIRNCTEALKELKGNIDQISLETGSLSASLKEQLDSLKQLRGRDYTTFTEDEQLSLGAMVNNTKALSAMLNVTVGG